MLNKLNRVKLNKLNEENNEFYSNINEVSWVFNIEGEGLYKFKCGDDSNILVNSIELITKVLLVIKKRTRIRIN